MSCDRYAAVRRLVAFHVARCLDDPNYAAHVPLSEVLTRDNIEAVSKLNLFADFDTKQRTATLNNLGWDEHRARELVRAWLKPRGKAVRQ